MKVSNQQFNSVSLPIGCFAPLGLIQFSMLDWFEGQQKRFFHRAVFKSSETTQLNWKGRSEIFGGGKKEAKLTQKKKTQPRCLCKAQTIFYI